MPVSADSPLAEWNAPECPFAVAYVPRVLDDIRLAVVDAFFSLPRGGAEIGGLLLGGYEGDRLTITDWQALECDHAFGPSFTLSDADRSRMAGMIAAAKNPGSRAVGWYHSHTRSEIFLSEADREIHSRFFPEPWQVALILRPHTFNPTRAGFFFRAKDGAIRADASCLEFVLDALPARPLPSREAAAPELRAAQARAAAAAAGAGGPVIDVSQVVEEPPVPLPVKIVEPAEPIKVAEPAPPVKDVEPAPRRVAEPPPPSFLTAQKPSHRAPWLAITGVLIGTAAGVGTFQTREIWLPVVTGWFHPPGPIAQASVGLRTLDRDGQLQILWDPSATDVRSGRDGILLITDGTQSRVIPLDAADLRAGLITYARQSGQVDVTLTLDQPNGRKVIEAATFVGKAPAAPPPSAATDPPAPPPSDAAGNQDDRGKDHDQLARENAHLRATVAAQAERIRQLENSLAVEKRLLEQHSRMQNQATFGGR